ncbi:hypothetical protein EAY64_05505 [Aquitalea palustris]|uniref:Uncharacterized protein n=1 Tax=Aquitalea palustris TaxID=2480983 RepID=A0A454JKX8_9NEIS|nr:hypothetical protein [Aquitalea palustris]RMD00053.1 hypothetical protein EAY64_05505 [Aquitalea palustris]
MGWSAAAMVAATVYSASQSKAPTITAPSAAEAVPASQAASTPTAESVQSGINTSANGGAGSAPSAASTMLTGAGGVDPNSLNLQKNTLLGS